MHATPIMSIHYLVNMNIRKPTTSHSRTVHRTVCVPSINHDYWQVLKNSTVRNLAAFWMLRLQFSALWTSLGLRPQFLFLRASTRSRFLTSIMGALLLGRVWKHTNLSTLTKIRVYFSCLLRYCSMARKCGP